MNFKPDEVASITFPVHDENGELQDAKSIPVGVLVKSGVDTGTAVVCTKVSTGYYKAMATFGAAGWSAGDQWELRINATIETASGDVSTAGIVRSGRIVGKLTDDLVDFDPTVSGVDVAEIEGNDATAYFETVRDAIIARGDTAWMTATGFSTALNVSDAQAAIIARGDAAWLTATGFATPVNVSDAQTAIITRGDIAWITSGGGGGNNVIQIEGADATDYFDAMVTNIQATVTTARDAILADTGVALPGLINALNNVSAGDVRVELDANSTQLAAIVDDTGTDLPALINAAVTHGDANWGTAAGFSTHSDADVAALLTIEHGAGSWTTGAGGPGGGSDPEVFARLRPRLPQNGRGELCLTVGDAYAQSEGRALEYSPRNDCGIEHDGWPDLTGAVVAIEFCECPASGDEAAKISTAGSVITATGQQLVRFELTAADTDVPAGRYSYNVTATLANGNVVTLECGHIWFRNAC